MTGTYKLKHAGVDVSEADNGVSNTVWFSPVQLVDKDGDALGVFGSTIYPNGDIRSRISVSNGGQSASFFIGKRKNGDTYYVVDDAPAFRSAAGVPAMSGAYNGNLNNLVEPGVYYLAKATVTGEQEEYYGMLIVAAATDGSRAVQLHIDVWRDIAKLRRYTGSWQPWKQFTLT